MISTAQIKKRFYIGAFLRGFIIWYAVEKLYYLDGGLSLQDAALIGFFSWVPQILFEIPSSTLADRWNRRKVIALGCTGILLSTILVVNSQTLIQFIGSITVWSLSVSLISGTVEALLYDLLKNNNQQKDYQQAQFRARASFLFGIFASGIAAFIMIKLGLPLSYTFWASIPFSLLAITYVFYIPEAKISRTTHQNLNWYKHINSAFKELRSHLVRWLALVLVAVIAFRSVLYEYHQLIGIDKGLDYSQIAFLFSAIVLSMAFINFFFSKVKLNSVIINLIWFGLFLSTVFGLLLSGFWAVTVNLIIVFVCAEFIEQYIQLEIQHHIESSKRATILSIASGLGQIGFLVSAVVFVLLIEKLGASVLTTLCALPLIGLGLIEVMRFKKRNIIGAISG